MSPALQHRAKEADQWNVAAADDPEWRAGIKDAFETRNKPMNILYRTSNPRVKSIEPTRGMR